MLVVISPAKKLDETPMRASAGTEPVFQSQANILAEVAAKLSSDALAKLMHISPKLAALNVERLQKFGTGAEAKPASEMFAGDTYTGLDAASLDADELAYAQHRLCILSGMYGLLRPGDLIVPHRLEMGSRLTSSRGKNLYEFWGDQITDEVAHRAKAANTDILVNCASIEYFSAVNANKLDLRIITPQFYELKDGKPKIVSFYAKKARGAMARYIVQNRLTDASSLKSFDLGGYQYDAELSKGDTWGFLRQPEA